MTISNVLAPTAGTGTAVPTPAAGKNTNQFAARSTDNPPPVNPAETATTVPKRTLSRLGSPTDNTVTNAQNEPTHKPPQDFSHTLRKTIMPKTPQNTQDGTELKKQSLTTNTAAQPNVVQLWLAQYSLMVEQGKEGIARKVEPKAGYELAQLLTNLKADKFSSVTAVTARTAKSTPAKLGQMVAPSLQPENKPIQSESPSFGLFAKGEPSAIDQGQTEPKAVLPGISKELLATNTEQGGGKNADKTPTVSEKPTIASTSAASSSQKTSPSGVKELMAETLNSGSKTPTVSEKPTIASTSVASSSQKTSPSGVKELMAEALNSGNKTPTVSEKPTIASTSAASSSQKTPPSGVKELMDEALNGGSKTPAAGKTTAGQKPAMAGTSTTSADQKTPVSDDNLPMGEGKLSGSEPKIPVNLGKFTAVSEKPTDNKAATPQGETLSEPLADNKGQTDTAAVESTAQNLNMKEVQISTGQTKDHGSTSDNSSKPTDFGQITSHSNLDSPITEQTSAFAQAGKSTNSTSASDVFPSINEQIFESIHSFLRQGDRQITIRLYPPELGKVIIKFQEQQGQLSGLLEVSKIQTRAEIQQALPQIIRNLADCGIQVKRLEVVLTDQPEQQTFREQSLQQGWSGQHGSENPDSRGDNTPVNEWLTNYNSYAGLHEPQEMFVADNSINILI